MTALGIGNLYMGTTNTNPFVGPAPNLTAQGNAVGMIELFESRRLMRGVIGLDGDIGEKWTWNAYYERSETHQFETGLNNNIVSDLLAAEDAVRVGSYTAHYTAAGYPNPLGLPLGSITCLSNLLPVGALGRTTTCSPLNIFGNGPGVASQEAINYVNHVTRAGGETDHTNLFEDVGAVSLQGTLPFGLSAGPIAMAVGAQYRDELGFRPNCGLNCSEVNFPFGNFANFKGNYNVKEGSLEFNAPILKDSFVKDLSLDAAYRAIDYSTSGFVQTYKFGIVSQLTDAVRLRASYSRDIRAGNMFETFAQAQTIGTAGPNPKLANASVPLFVVAGGNQNIQPEQAETRTAGFVLTPFQGFTSSIDWYYIRIKDVINQGFSVGQIVGLCEQGQGKYCADLVWGKYPGGCSSANINDCASNVLAGVIALAVNSDWETTSGLDFLADYRMPFGQGFLDFNLDTNYVFELRYNSLGTTCDPMNGIGFDQFLYQGCNPQGVPKFRGTFATSYAQGAWLGTVQLRGIGAAHLVSNWTSGVQVDNNDIPFQTYVDLRLSYKFDNGVSLYGAVDNAFDRWQPYTPFSPFSATAYEPPTRDDIYDGFGRVWRVGVRAKF
jgi:outer membrane receptor protein involved in Fe transport